MRGERPVVQRACSPFPRVGAVERIQVAVAAVALAALIFARALWWLEEPGLLWACLRLLGVSLCSSAPMPAGFALPDERLSIRICG